MWGEAESLYPDWVRGLVTRLLALPVRPALLGEGRGALDGVLRPEHLVEELPLPLPELRVGLGEPVDEDGLGGGQRQRSVGGDGLGQRERLVEGAAGVDDAVHEADPAALLAA